MRLLSILGVTLCFFLFCDMVTFSAGQRGGFFQALSNFFGGGNNNNNNNNNNFRQGGGGGNGRRYPQYLDTSDGRFSRFNGPVRGIPRDHGGGRFGAANCLLCPNGS